MSDDKLPRIWIKPLISVLMFSKDINPLISIILLTQYLEFYLNKQQLLLTTIK